MWNTLKGKVVNTWESKERFDKLVDWRAAKAEREANKE